MHGLTDSLPNSGDDAEHRHQENTGDRPPKGRGQAQGLPLRADAVRPYNFGNDIPKGDDVAQQR